MWLSLNIPDWDKIILTFNWASPSMKQEEMMKNFIIKYFSYLQKPNTQSVP
jgi:hypothetical protein